MKMRSRLILVAIFPTLLASCGEKSEIKVYRVSKAPLEESNSPSEETMPTNAGSPAAPMGTARSVSAPVITPPNWEPQPLSQMRQASFMVKGANGATADISFVTLGAGAGNVLENVNRWLSQLDQPPITDEKLAQIAQRLSTSMGDLAVVDLAGLPKNGDPAKDGRIIAAMGTTNDSTLFFKMRGNAELTEAQKAEFIKWVAAVCNGQLKSNTTPTQPESPGQATNRQVKWETPATWKETPPSSMRYASFNALAPNGDKVDVSIVTFPGDGGSDADNVNRWRQQLGLPPADENTIRSAIIPVQTPDATYSTVDISGNNVGTIAAWTRRNGHVWFFKATGPSSALQREKPNFVKFVQSVRF